MSYECAKECQDIKNHIFYLYLCQKQQLREIKMKLTGEFEQASAWYFAAGENNNMIAVRNAPNKKAAR